MTRRARADAGFTLVEMMVVLAIIAILAGLAAARVADGKDLDQIANQAGNSVREASRLSAAAGPVSPQALTAGETAQVRLHIWGDAANDKQIVAIEKFTDPGAGLVWRVLSSFAITGKQRIVGYRSAPDINPGSAPQISLGPADQVTIDCNPRGACAASTLYFEDAGKGTRMKVVTMPLHGAPQVIRGW